MASALLSDGSITLTVKLCPAEDSPGYAFGLTHADAAAPSRLHRYCSEGTGSVPSVPAKLNVALAEDVRTAGLPVIATARAVVSLTVTVNDPVVALPEASVAVQSTVVVPIANVAPEAGAQDTAGFGSVSSTAVAV